MKKQFFIPLLFILSCQLSIGQELYRDGFILKSPFDTVYGKVKYYSYKEASINCVFKAENSTSEQSFSPNEIFGYGIDDDILFVSRSIGENQQLFLEVVYQGTVTLYAYRDKYRKNYFYLENPIRGDFEQLTQKVIGTKRRRNIIKTYQDVLKIMLEKSDLILDRIENASLSHRSLSNLLLDYDQRYARYRGKQFNGTKSQWPPTPGFYVIQGSADQKLGNFSGTGESYYAGIGIKFQKEISRATRRLYFDLDLTLTHEAFNQRFMKTEEVTDQSQLTNGLNFLISSTNTDIRGTVESITNLDLERYNLGMPMNIKYIFPTKKWLFTINGGFSPQYTVAKNGEVQGILSQNDTILLDIVSPEDTDRFRFGINFGFGLMLKTSRTYFLDFQHSPTWLNQGVLKYKYSFIRLGILLDKGN
ncbi:hypothetical protein [Roseivirga misakiensis]|uniref:Outer membrane protein beta-barrel domain-containing protein n=1 Tax=Roseivirga misakiensis TaxID=1563681 RepID=A0A1E5T112_9BACT|nr:hypothetical protein [Roseivirga misakiensis]OEK05072.1 hypothetical protein BFP71_16775 [Roseivirga misakiensis]